jgi:hypothetical protein
MMDFLSKAIQQRICNKTYANAFINSRPKIAFLNKRLKCSIKLKKDQFSG